MQSVGLSERGKSLILGMTFLLSATWNLLWTCTVVFSVHCASSLAVLRVRIPLSICYAGQQQEGEQDGSAEFFSFSYLAEKAAENNCGDSVSVVDMSSLLPVLKNRTNGPQLKYDRNKPLLPQVHPIPGEFNSCEGGNAQQLQHSWLLNGFLVTWVRYNRICCQQFWKRWLNCRGTEMALKNSWLKRRRRKR